MVEITNLGKGNFTLWAGFLGDRAIFLDSEGYARTQEHPNKRIELHEGALGFALGRNSQSLVTSGEDGKICRLQNDLNVELIYQAENNWIDKITVGSDNLIAFGSGRKGAILETGKSPTDLIVTPLEVERSIEGLAFAPKGKRLAIARYDGVELHWVRGQSKMLFLEWKGAHTDVVFSPDGKYVVSTMQENALHGWRLSDAKHMRMSGYPSKVNSTSWSPKGKWLATSGAPAAIVWPFSGKDGPMGKAPKELASMGKFKVTQVCCHPAADMLAIGYENGMIMAASIDDEKVVSLRAEGLGPVSTMGWNSAGNRLAFGSEEGEAGVVELS